jgi:hypothetical protein
LGIKYTFIISFAVVCVLALFIYLFVWETTFYRNTPEVRPPGEISEATAEKDDTSSSISGSKTDLEKKGFDVAKTETVETKAFDVAQIEAVSPTTTGLPSGPPDAKYTWRQQQKVFRGRITKRSLLQAIVQPFPLLLFPSVVFSTIVHGAFMSWLIMSGLLKFQVMAYPPYNLKPDMLAYINLPGSVVNLFTAIFSGLFSDWLIKFMSRRNKGVYEPEFRLLLMLPAAIFSTMAFLLLGRAYEYKWSVGKIIACGLCFHISVPFATNASMTYIYDTQRTTTTEAVVASSLVKSVFAYFVTTYVPTWFAKVGPLRAFNTLAVLNICFAALTIPMYIFGKKLRGAVCMAFLSSSFVY